MIDMHISKRSTRALALLSLLPVLAACQWGTRPRTFPPAQSPVGATVAVRIVGEPADRVGELYAADAAGVMVRGQRLARFPWTQIAALDVHRMGGDYDVAAGVTPDTARIARLAALSRFPQGLSGELLRRVLERLPQDSVDGVGALTLDSIARSAERESARFQDRRVATAEGYRRIGADFPGMGEHWVNPAALLTDVIDPARPSFLTYVTMMSGEPRLMGVGFITTTSSASKAPDVPGFAQYWHEHSGLLSDESGARATENGAPVAERGARVAHSAAAGTDDRGSRVWVLHVWTALENPDGRFAADNWSLPFARAGVTPPATPDADAARAFGLAGQERGDDFLRALLSDAGLRTAAKAAATDSIVAAARARAVVIAARVPPGSAVDERSLMELRTVWREMAASLEGLLGGHVAALLAPPHRPRGHEHATH